MALPDLWNWQWVSFLPWGPRPRAVPWMGPRRTNGLETRSPPLGVYIEWGRQRVQNPAAEKKLKEVLRGPRAGAGVEARAPRQSVGEGRSGRRDIGHFPAAARASAPPPRCCGPRRRPPPRPARASSPLTPRPARNPEPAAPPPLLSTDIAGPSADPRGGASGVRALRLAGGGDHRAWRPERNRGGGHLQWTWGGDPSPPTPAPRRAHFPRLQ